MADLRLVWALVAVIVRYLSTIRTPAHRELARWRLRAHTIPDPDLRSAVLRAFDSDMSAEGAAVFAVLQPRYSPGADAAARGVRPALERHRRRDRP